MTQMVETLRYKPEGSIPDYVFLPAALCAGSASNRNEYQ